MSGIGNGLRLVVGAGWLLGCAVSSAQVPALFEFALPETTTVPLNLPAGLVAADMDADGLADVVVIDADSSQVSIHAGTGSGLSAGELVSVPGPVHGVAAGDLDGDGSTDLVLASRDSDELFLCTELTAGVFATTSLAVDPDPLSLALGDLDGDGDLDLAVGHLAGSLFGDGQVGIHLSDGAGSFVLSQVILVPGGVTDVLFVDVDADGDRDLVAASPGAVPAAAGALTVALNDGAGDFASPSSWVGTPTHLVPVDVDGDGDLDLVATRADDVVCSPFYTVYLGDGFGGFTAVLQFVGCYPFDLCSGDFDLDGVPDLAFADLGAADPLVFARGDGSGGFEPDLTVALPAVSNLLALDIDLDGDPDLVSMDSVNASLCVSRNLALGGVEFSRGDVNGDGAIDVADAIAGLAALFVPGTPPPPCSDAADANDDGVIDISDPVGLLDHLFGSGAPLPPPSPSCGVDPTPDSLGCAAGGPSC